MDRFLNEDNIIKKNNNIQKVLQKANLLKQQTQQKLNQLTPEQLALTRQDKPIRQDTSIQQDELIQVNNFNELSIQDEFKQAQSSIQINSLENYNIQHNNLNQINATSELEMDQLKQNDININTDINDININNTDINDTNINANINDINTNHMINSILHAAEQSINNTNNNQFNINNQSDQLINMQQKQDAIFDAANQLKTNNLANFQNNSNNENIINKENNINTNNEENIINNLNKDIKALKKEILKTDKIFTPQETLIKKQIQAYNELVNLQVELEIINRMSIRVEEKLRQSYNTKTYNLQIRIREQEVRLGVIADLLSGKS